MQTQTLERAIERKFEVTEKRSLKKISKDFSEQGYCGFIEKLRLHEKESAFIFLAPFLDEIMQSYKFEEISKELLNIQEKKQIIEIKIYSFKEAKGLNIALEYDVDMEREKNLEEITKIQSSKQLREKQEELITPWQFLRRMTLLAYASFYVTLKYGFVDAEIDYRTGKITPIYEKNNTH